jgi:VWFA-related protein
MELQTAFVKKSNEWIGLLIAASISVHSQASTKVLSKQAQTRSDEQSQTVRLKAELIEVRAVVTDRKGRPITNLNKEDFELLENGRRQSISFFSVELIKREGEGGIRSDRTQAVQAKLYEQPARTIALFVDTLHLSPTSLLTVKQSIRKFVMEQLEKGDLIAIVDSTATVNFIQQSALEKRGLLYAIDRLTPWGQVRNSNFTPYLAAMVERGDRDALHMARRIIEAEEAMPNPDLRYVRSRARTILHEAAWKRRITLSTLEGVAERMANMPGQKIIAYISDGFTLMDAFGSTEEINRVTSRAVRSGVAIYSLYTKGLEPNPAFGQWEMENGLNALASDTGGRAFFNTNDLNRMLEMVLGENRVYYVLGYYPAEGKGDRFRQITVRVKNHPEYDVRAPKGYAPIRALKEKTAQTPRQQLFQAIAAPLPVSDLGITVSAGFLESKADAAQASIFVHLDGNRLNYIEHSGRYKIELDMVAVVYDAEGRPVRTVDNKIDMVIRPEGLEQAKLEGYHFVQRAKLKPGLYQVRVGVREPSTQRIGTAVAWVEVPDLKRGQLTLSDLFTCEQEMSAPEKFRWIQSAGRLKKADSLVYCATIYNAPAPPENLLMQVEIFKDQNQIYTSAWKTVSSCMIGSNENSIEIASQIVLKDMEPGVYELRVAIKDPRSKQAAQKSMMFEIEQ